jgi:MoaA/NifB/PqqE/SkfB family radical SAM enzyme
MNGSLIRPRMIANFAVTYKCTGRCKNCNIWKIEAPRARELTLEEIRAFFDSNRSFLRDIESMQITGGEPFMRADLADIVSAIRGSIPRCSFWIPTNGLAPSEIEGATREIMERLGGWGLSLSVSIDGLAQTNDSIRGVDGGFKKAVETLGELSALKGEFPGLNLSVGMTVTRENVEELTEVYKIAREHEAELSLRTLNLSGVYYRNLGMRRPSEDLIGHLLPSLRGIGRDIVGRKGLWVSTPTLRYMQGLIEYIRHPVGPLLPCSAGSLSLFLDPYGDVYPCIFVNDRLGSIREASLEEIWQSEVATKARRRINDGDCPGCWVECEAYRDIRRDLRGLMSAGLKALINPSTLGIE